MPYRRLPNTDTARLKALKAAYSKAKELPPFKLAFSQATYQKIQSFLPLFEKNITESRTTYNAQITKSKDYQLTLRKARLYISHFIQVLNMSIQRGEMPSTARIYYGISESDKCIPSLTTEESVFSWGERLIVGESERIRKGGSPVTNPTIAMVRVKFDQFKDAFHSQKTLKKSSQRNTMGLADLRVKADEIIAKAWDEIENSFKELTEEDKRKSAENYGVVYVFRKNELNKLIIPQALQPQMKSLFL